MNRKKYRTKEQHYLALTVERIAGMAELTRHVDPRVMFGASPIEARGILEDIKVIRPWFDALAQQTASIAEAA